MPADGPTPEVRTENDALPQQRPARRRGAHRATSSGPRRRADRPDIPRGRGAHRAGAHRRPEVVDLRPAESLGATAALSAPTPAIAPADDVLADATERGRGVSRSAVAAATVVVTAVGAGVAGSVVTGPVGHASPPPTVKAVEKKVAALNDRMDRVVENYDRARIDLKTAKQQAAVAKQRVAAARQRLAQARADLAEVAAAAYRGATGADGLVKSFVAADNPQQFVDQTSTLDEISRSRIATLRAVTAAERQLAEAQRQAADELAAAQRIAVKIAKHRAEIRRALREQRQLLGRLQAKQRAALAARQQAAAAQQAATGASALASGNYAHGSGAAAVAVQWAYRELGKPYVWGAAGPSSFDCSGLTMYVWGQAGVGLPHSAAAQYGSGTPVSQSSLQPGDLVFFGSPIHHVGIYVGGGNMIEAPHTGDVVKMIPLAYEPGYVGAVRP